MIADELHFMWTLFTIRQNIRPVKVGYFAQSSGINVAVQNDTELVFSNIQNNFMLLK